jgi:hypothetical protein
VYVRDADNGLSQAYLELPPVEVGNSPPRAVFSMVSGASVGDPVRLDASSSGDFEQTLLELSVKWRVEGESKSYSGPSVYAIFDKPGTYKVNLTVTDKDGARSCAEKTITIAAKPWQAGGSSSDIAMVTGGAALIVAAVAIAGVTLVRRRRAAELRRRKKRRSRKAPGPIVAQKPKG